MSFLTANDCFAVFREPDGSRACVCMRCLLTVAVGTNKAELQRNEVEHFCRECGLGGIDVATRFCLQTATPEPDFTRRSGTESVCMWCYATIRVKTPDLLENEEHIHASVCIQRPDSPFRNQPK